MIILAGKKFAETEGEFTNSLFELGGTCYGYAKRNKHSIVLEDQHHTRIAVINANGCLCAAHRLTDGRYWYNYDTPAIFKITSYTELRDSIDKLHIDKIHIMGVTKYTF